MKRTKIFVTAAFAAATLAGVGFAFKTNLATADDIMPSAEFYAQTLSLEDNIHIKYAVDFDGLTEGDHSGVLVWRTAQENYAFGTQDAALTVSYETLEENENAYPVYAFTNLSAKEMTDNVYAVAYVERGGEYYYSAVKKYSILEYAYNKLGKTEAEATEEEDLKALLNGMLAYGGAAQTYFDYKTETLASDAFAYVRVENATFADGFSYGLFKAGTEVVLTPDEGYELSENAPEYWTAGQNGEIILTVPTEKTVETQGLSRISSQGLEYALNEDGVSYSVTGLGTCTDTELVIPSTHEGLPVTAIADEAFFNCESLTSVVIGDSVTVIGVSAFGDCYNITNAVIGNNVEVIGDYAFFTCESLTEIVIPDSVTVIGAGAFDTCWRITSAVIGNNVEVIGDSAFFLCSGLTEIVMPNGLKSLGGGAFDRCDSLQFNVYGNAKYLGSSTNEYFALVEVTDQSYTSYAVHDQTKIIAKAAFYNCKNLTEINVGENNTAYMSVNGNLYTKDGKTLVQYAIGKTESSFTIPDGVESIGDYAFYYCSSLTEIVIPDDVESIGYSTFAHCTNLSSIIIEGDSLTSIGVMAFYDCSSLTEIALPNSVTSIRRHAFGHCKTLTEIVIPDSVTSIGDGAFYGCSSLASVVIGDGVTSIGCRMFDNCKNLKEIAIPDNVTNIDDEAFYQCPNLTSITVSENNTEYKSIDGDLYTKDGKTLVRYAIGKTASSFTIPYGVESIGVCAFAFCANLTEILIPNSVTSIGNYAFYNCKILTEILIPDSVTSIGNSAFSGCSSLTEIVIPDGVTGIGSNAFAYCKTLTEIVIPDRVTSIGYSAFSGCSSLASVVIGDGVTSIGPWAFYNCKNLTSVYYKGTAEAWGNIVVGENNSPLTNATVYYYTQSEPALNAEGTAYDGNYWRYDTDGVTPVVLVIGSLGLEYALNEDGVSYSVTGLGTCTDTDIVIPSVYGSLPVTSIGYYAFYGCNNLTSVVIGDSVESIGNYAFFSCRNLTSAVIGNGVTSIGSQAFELCPNLTSITVSENNASYKSIDGDLYTKDGKTLVQYAIAKTASSFTILDGVESIGEYAFTNCLNLASVVIPYSVESIGVHTFNYCWNLTSIRVSENNTFYKSVDGNLYTKDGKTLIQYAVGKTASSFAVPDGVESISRAAFQTCESLTSVVLSNSVKDIGERAFEQCFNLASVVIPNSVESIGQEAFWSNERLSSIYYNGTAEAWENIVVGENNSPLTNATVYYYTESEPALNAEGTAYDGNYWHYDTDGVTPVVWVYTKEE